MACYHPLKAFKIGVNPSSGKDMLKVVPFKTDHVEKRADGKIIESDLAYSSPYSTVYRDSVDIPCGKCIGCRLDKSREWANRCSVELSYYKYNYFVTFTYNDDHLPINYYLDEDTGEIKESQTLYKRDFQLFMKRLRKAYNEMFPDEQIRFYMSGEYGSRSFRPHYHSIMFNLFIPDLKPYKQNAQGDWLYTSEWLNSLWTTPKDDVYKRSSGILGYVVIGEVDWESIAYVSRYTIDKLNGKLDYVYEKFNIEKEFSLMSRRPGIGKQFYEDHKSEISTQDKFYIKGRNGARPFTIPRYYSNLYAVEFPDRADQIKEQNKKFMEAYKKEKERLGKQDYLDLLRIEEHNKLESIKALKREL